MMNIIMLVFWYTFIFSYMCMVIRLDQFIESKLSADVYDVKINDEIKKMLEDVLKNENHTRTKI